MVETGYFWSKSFAKASSSFVSEPHYHPGNRAWHMGEIYVNVACMVFAIIQLRFTKRVYK